MTTEAAARLYEAKHLNAMHGKGWAIVNPHNKPLAELPVIYGFNNGGSLDGILPSCWRKTARLWEATFAARKAICSMISESLKERDPTGMSISKSIILMDTGWSSSPAAKSKRMRIWQRRSG